MHGAVAAGGRHHGEAFLGGPQGQRLGVAGAAGRPELRPRPEVAAQPVDAVARPAAPRRRVVDHAESAVDFAMPPVILHFTPRRKGTATP